MSTIVKHTINLKTLTICATIVCLIALFLYVFEAQKRFKEVSDILAERLVTTEQTVQTISTLSSEIGYGGFIHNFKNYVLRRDPSYKEKAEQNYQRATKQINDLKQANLGANFTKELDDIRYTIDQYFKNLMILSPDLISDQVTMDDRLVKVDDSLAIEGFRKIYQLQSKVTQTTLELAKEKEQAAQHFISYGYILILNILATAALIFALIHRIQTQTHKAERASQAKSDFLLTMSHEIRTPLNGILGLIQLLNVKKLTREEKHQFGLIQSSGELLLGILNNVLDLDKMEKDKLRLEQVPTDLDYLLQTTTDFYKNLASENGLLLNYYSNLQDAGYLMCDPTKLRQVLSNLLSNALKYTKEGRIEVYACVSKLQSQQDRRFCNIKIEISDTGIGMNEDKCEEVFDKYKNNGLGLVIVKELVKLMDGEISLISTPNKGTEFTIQIPFAKATKEELQHHKTKRLNPNHSMSGLRALVAEDNLVNAVVAKGFLEHMGLMVSVAHDGYEATRLFKEKSPDLILMDINMPHLDGLEATKAIRQMSNGHDVPILALTADAFTQTKEKCMQVGMNGVITKPFTFEHFKQRIFDAVA
ncbi:MAG: response regulator [Methylocystaceae bacterium]|nr:response regulator [Methylocystaceae bacterium]